MAYQTGSPRDNPGSNWYNGQQSSSDPVAQQQSHNSSTRQMQHGGYQNNHDLSSQAPGSYSSRDRPSAEADRQRQLANYHAHDLQPPNVFANGERKNSLPTSNSSRRASGAKMCAKCGEPLSGQFVRALDNTYHLECFTCHECGKIVASKFFPVPDEGPDQYPLCETDYFRRLDLLCHSCGGALRGSYITALDRKYHIEHFTCSVCPTVFGAQDSYYEHEGNVYCHYHYSTRFAQRCQGCHNAILKQFVEIFRNGQNQHWHPECYMIHKYWNVRLHDKDKTLPQLDTNMTEAEATDEIRKSVRDEEERVEEKVLWIWRTLSAFEERSAQCISDMLVSVSNGAYMEGILAARKFIVHIELFFDCTDELDRDLAQATGKGLSYTREAKLLCKKVVAFFQLLSQSQTAGMQRLGVTQELLSLVTGLAHYLKLLIRICLQGSLKLERETSSPAGIQRFLDQINTLEEALEKSDRLDDPSIDSPAYVSRAADVCPVCEKPVEDKCARRGDRVFHLHTCMSCKNCGVDLSDSLQDALWSNSSQMIVCKNCAFKAPDAEGGFVLVSKLQQYVHLLKVAHARLLASLRSNGALPHTADDPNLGGYDSNQGHRVGLPNEQLVPPMLRSNTRSKSYTGTPSAQADQRRGSTSYDQTLNDIRRLRSTRMSREMSNSMKRARSSRIIDGPGGLSATDGDQMASGMNKRSSLQIVHDRDVNGDAQLTFGGQSMALDDIPRLVAAEQARDQRPNAAKYARNNLVGQTPKPKLVNGHQRYSSGGNDLEKIAAQEGAPYRNRKFFSELSALEYFIVRHIAVLSMEPLLDGQFNQQELLDLIENKRPTFWDRFGKAFKNDKAANKKKGVFGKSLDAVCDRDGADSTDGVGPGALRVPAVVENAVSAMRNMDMSVEGVFRKNGNIRRLRELAEEIDTKGSEAVDLTREPPVQVAALLKKFLRELPDPILSHKLHKLWITAAKIPEEDRRRRVLHLTCCLLPKVHRDTMEVLFTFLVWVSSFSTVDEESGSKMDIHNLATVIAPNILYSNVKEAGREVDSSFLAIEAVNSLIECNESMCEVPEDLLSILNDTALFENNGELTTKEILKRWGEIGKVPQATTVTSANGTPTKGQKAHEPWNAVTQVTGDPGAWQNESSVRHVGGQNQPTGGANTVGPSSNGTTYGPSAQQAAGGIKPPPTIRTYSNQPGDGNIGSPNRQTQFRAGANQNQKPTGQMPSGGPGPLGITGAG